MLSLKHLFLIAAAIACFNNISAAQPGLTGKITDATHSGITGVTVYIPEMNKFAVTDKSGQFHFNGSYNGIIRLQCTMLGFNTEIRTVDLNKNQENITIILSEGSVSIGEVLVTSNQTLLSKDIPYCISTLTAEDIRNSGKPTLMENLAQKPGVDLISGGSGISKPVVRGLSFNRIVLHSMGTRIENQQWDDDHDAGIAEAGIDHVEIVYGPSALIYGADALGGALIFADEKPAPAGASHCNANVGYFSNTAGINADVGFKETGKSGWFYIGRVGDQSHTDYMQGGPLHSFASNSRYNNLNAKAVIGHSHKNGVSKMNYSYLRSTVGMIVDAEEEEEILNTGGKIFEHRSRQMQAPSQDVNLQVISSENTFLSGANKWNLNAAYQTNIRSEFEPSGAGDPANAAMGLILKTLTYDIKMSTSENRKYGVVAGLQGMKQLNSNFGNNIAVPDASVGDYAAYALFHNNTGKWNLLGGIRMDVRTIHIKETSGVHEGEATLDQAEQAALDSSGLNRMNSSYTKEYVPLSFSAGSAFHPDKNITLKTNIATGFSAPNYAELSTFGKHEGTLRFEIGNPELKAEQNIEVDLNAEIEKPFVTISGGYFYNFIRDYIYLSPTGEHIADLQVIAYMQNDAIIRGEDAGVAYHPLSLKRLQFNLNYSHLNARLSDGSSLPYIPADKIYSEIILKSKNQGFISVAMDHRFPQDHPALYEDATGGYTLINLSTGLTLKNKAGEIGLTLSCSNVFNIAFYSHLSIVKDIGVYNMGRNVAVKISVRV